MVVRPRSKPVLVAPFCSKPPVEKDELAIKRARLMYQARKRGTLETGILLSHFAKEYLPTFSSEEMDEFNKIMCHPAGEWAIYYWAVGKDPFPDDLKDSKVLKKLKEFAANAKREKRLSQPDLY